MKLKVESKLLYRLQFLPNEVMHVLNCPLKLYLTNSHRHLDLLCLLIDPCFPKTLLSKRIVVCFTFLKKGRFGYFEKSNANILQTISCFKQVHKKWGVLCFFVQANLFVLVEFRSRKLPFTIYTVVLNDTFHPLKCLYFYTKGFHRIRCSYYISLLSVYRLYYCHTVVSQILSHCGNSAKKN